MCATCVAQGAPYVVGSLVALRVMASRSGRRSRATAEMTRSAVTPMAAGAGSTEGNR